jgi:hypothetical protein
VLDKWYALDLAKKQSYHTDHGEGFDGFHVGDTRGCGGLGLWVDGKLVTADVYQIAEVAWTGPEVAEFRTLYQYPLKIAGKPVYELRTTRLRMGSRFSEVVSQFTHSTSARGKGGKPIADFPYEAGIGLTTQTADAKTEIDPAKGFISVYGPFPGGGLGTAVLIDPAKIIRTQELPATDKERKNRQVLLITRPDAEGRVSYRCGFAWAGDGAIKTPAQWLDFLKQQP